MEQPPSSTLAGFSPGSLTGKSPQGKIEMVFRFWGGNAKGHEPAAGEHGPAHNPGVLALIEDVAASKRGVFLSTHDQLYVSGLKHPADALVVSRQVQLGLQGFGGRHGSGPVAVSIAIDASAGDRSTLEQEPGGDAAPSAGAAHRAPEPPHDLVTLLKLAKPAQILLTHDLCRQMAAVKGLPLKSFPGRFGVYEYLWTAEEKLDLLQSEPQLTLAALPPALPAPPGFNAPKGRDGQTIAPSGATQAIDLPPSPEGMVQPAGAAFQVRSLLAPRMLIFGGVGLAAVVAAVAVGIHMAHKPAPNAAPAAFAAPASIPPQTPAPANPPPAAAAQTLPAATQPAAPPSVEKPRTASTPAHAARQTANKPAAGAVPAAPAPACTLPAPAERLVELGEQSRGRGDYANAVRIFHEVLACDPNNAAARDGLEKASRALDQH